MKAVFVSKQQVAANILSFDFKPEGRTRYIAGQFTELHLPHDDVDDRGNKRWFTLSSAPHEEFLTITTNLADSGDSSFKKYLKSINIGQEVHLESPMGDFVLPKDSNIPLIFIAAGVGSTPFRSMIADMKNRREKRDIKMIYAARNHNEVAFGDLFREQLGDNFQELITGVVSHIHPKRKRLTSAYIIEKTQPSEKHYIYISGPEPMVEKISHGLEELGINRRHIFADFFHGYQPL